MDLKNCYVAQLIQMKWFNESYYENGLKNRKRKKSEIPLVTVLKDLYKVAGKKPF